MDEEQYEQGPTGAVLKDLPSPYEAHACGLLHLPRFIAKIRKHLEGKLPKSYQRNFTKGFDGFLCLHLGIEPEEVIAAVRENSNDESLGGKLSELFPDDLETHAWNRKLVQMGMAELAREKLEEVKEQMGAADRKDLLSFADVIEFDEGRLQ
tara:strand:+ start:566 stop:1021 length:456 start_codon:yes stop_codon:yes gene_type:complete